MTRIEQILKLGEYKGNPWKLTDDEYIEWKMLQDDLVPLARLALQMYEQLKIVQKSEMKAIGIKEHLYVGPITDAITAFEEFNSMPDKPVA